MFACCRWTCVHSASVGVAPVRALRGLALGSSHGREVCLILCGRSERAGCLGVALPQLQWASTLSQCSRPGLVFWGYWEVLQQELNLSVNQYSSCFLTVYYLLLFEECTKVMKQVVDITFKEIPTVTEFYFILVNPLFCKFVFIKQFWSTSCHFYNFLFLSTIK